MIDGYNKELIEALKCTEGSSGNVDFTPIVESEADLRELMALDNAFVDVFELGGLK
jgi:hypothetical protein